MVVMRYAGLISDDDPFGPLYGFRTYQLDPLIVGKDWWDFPMTCNECEWIVPGTEAEEECHT